MRYPIEVIDRVKQLRRDGLTLGEIVASTGLPKGTVFYYTKQLPKSNELQRKIKLKNQYKQKAITEKRRGKTLKKYSFIRPNWSANFVNLTAHFLFDGEVSSRSCIYNNRNLDLINHVVLLMKKQLCVNDQKFIQKPDGVYRVSYHNVEIASYMKEKEHELLIYVKTARREEKLAFLKAFFDDEGNVTLTPKKKLVRGYQHSDKILSLIQQLLLDVGIHSIIDYKYFEIYIGRRIDLQKFQQLINFSKGVRINGMRSNSIWKKSLEKREILNALLSSYGARHQ